MTFQPIENMCYYIRSQNSGLVLDVKGGAMDDSAQIIQYHNKGGENQKFEFEDLGDGYFKIVSKNSGLVMDVKGP